ncbi:MAG: phosphatidylserine decarboxylase [Candidatus Methanoperedens sp.]|nr:MAG: phosphatidylserine decarboxylase [Candidatus Methanoperedens sp.]
MLAKGSLSWIGASMMFTAVTGYFSINSSGFIKVLISGLLIIGLLLTLFLLVFFRDPERKPAGDEDDAVSPADGRVISKNDRTIGIFMNVHNVHVNRAPLSGIVMEIDYKPGGYIPASNKDSDVNERNYVKIKTDNGNIELTQIAGVLIRRIVSYISQGDLVKRGERIGMIRFGSRVDVIIPEVYTYTVSVGDKVKAGESIIARKKEKIRG